MRRPAPSPKPARPIGAARWLAAAALVALGGAQAQVDQPAIVSTLEDGSLSFTYADPAIGLPTPAAVPILLPAGARPHGSAYITQDQALIADFRGPARLYRISGGSGQLLSEIPVPGKSFGNGTIAVSPDGNSAIFAGYVFATVPRRDYTACSMDRALPSRTQDAQSGAPRRYRRGDHASPGRELPRAARGRSPQP